MSVNTKKLAARMQAVKNSASVLNKLAYSASIPVQYIHPSDDNLCAKLDTDESIADLAASMTQTVCYIRSQSIKSPKQSTASFPANAGFVQSQPICIGMRSIAESSSTSMGPNRFSCCCLPIWRFASIRRAKSFPSIRPPLRLCLRWTRLRHMKDLAKVLGVSDRQVKKYKAISSLSEEDQEAIQNGTLSINEAYAKATGKGEPVPLAPWRKQLQRGTSSPANRGQQPQRGTSSPANRGQQPQRGTSSPAQPVESNSKGEPVPLPYYVENFPVAQIQLPDPADTDPHPRLQFDGTAFMPAILSPPGCRTAGMRLHSKSIGTRKAQTAGLSVIRRCAMSARSVCGVEFEVFR